MLAGGLELVRAYERLDLERRVQAKDMATD